MDTPFVLRAAHVLLVGLDAWTARECEKVLDMLPTTKVEAMPEALEKILQSHPVMVVVAQSTDAKRPDLVERCAAIGAPIVSLDGIKAGPLLAARLQEGIRRAQGIRDVDT